MHKVGFILKGNSRKKSKFYKELQRSKTYAQGLEFHVVETSSPGHAASLASSFIHEGYSHIVAVGGDGTLHEALNGLMRKEADQVILGNYPLGTANDFIKSLPVPNTLHNLFEAVQADSHQHIDIGHIRSDDAERYFINIADIGIGAEVVKKVNASNKLLGANLTFFFAIIRSFLSYSNQAVRCQSGTWSYEGKVKSLVMANGKYFGSGLCIAPDAELDNGHFQVVILGNVSMSDYLKNMPILKKGYRVMHPEAYYKSGETITITSPHECAIEADGEFIGYCPATFSIKPRAVRFLIRQTTP